RYAKGKSPRTRALSVEQSARQRASEASAGRRDASQRVAPEGQEKSIDDARFPVGAVETPSRVPGHGAVRRRKEKSGPEDKPDAVAKIETGGEITLDRAGQGLGSRLEPEQQGQSVGV